MKKLSLFLMAFALLSPGAALAEGDAKAGKKVFKRCAACHATKEGKNKVGPSMYNIVGAKAGASEGYSYSKAFAELDLVWDEANLRTFLKGPKKMVPGTKMAFRGLKKDKDLDNIVAYLTTLSAD